MKIELNQYPKACDKFSVTVQQCLTTREVELIILVDKQNAVMLNKHEIQKLFAVVEGRDCSTIIFKDNVESDYDVPHTALFYTPNSGQPAGIFEIQLSREHFTPSSSNH